MGYSFVLVLEGRPLVFPGGFGVPRFLLFLFFLGDVECPMDSLAGDGPG